MALGSKAFSEFNGLEPEATSFLEIFGSQPFDSCEPKIERGTMEGAAFVEAVLNDVCAFIGVSMRDMEPRRGSDLDKILAVERGALGFLWQGHAGHESQGRLDDVIETWVHARVLSTDGESSTSGFLGGFVGDFFSDGAQGILEGLEFADDGGLFGEDRVPRIGFCVRSCPSDRSVHVNVLHQVTLPCNAIRLRNPGLVLDTIS